MITLFNLGTEQQENNANVETPVTTDVEDPAEKHAIPTLQPQPHKEVCIVFPQCKLLTSPNLEKAENHPTNDKKR